MDELMRALPDKDRELLIRPYDARWEAILTVYGKNGRKDSVSRAVGSNVVEALRSVTAQAEQ